MSDKRKFKQYKRACQRERYLPPILGSIGVASFFYYILPEFIHERTHSFNQPSPLKTKQT